MQRSLSKWLVTVGIGVGLFLIPRPVDVTAEAWALLAIFIATIVGSIVQPLTGSAIVLIGVVALALFRVVPIERALTGFADKFVWLVLAAFFISRAMIKTGAPPRAIRAADRRHPPSSASSSGNRRSRRGGMSDAVGFRLPGTEAGASRPTAWTQRRQGVSPPDM